ncbi:MAG: AlkA N-terminal domain-containing protein [Acidimicrobiia bacterium]|nr:AlkA N-terminal domain-containing protein [Acidimicrobiia bacterium]
MQFQAVRTTGIYCRAGCAATPHPKNVAPFANAVAAEAAGFRPCLRCRPERVPERLNPAGSPVVEHAVLLISEGFLDRHTEDELAARVGYSTRHLRRLFNDSVGASPSFVARSRRAHFARRLLDESDLPVSAISRAAGFTSTRQMNRVMREVFRFTPTGLRSRRRAADRLVTDGGLRLRIPYEGLIEWDTALDFLERRAMPGVEQISGGVYRRLTTTCGYPGVIEVGDHGDGRHLEIVAHLPTFASIVDDVARVRQLFGLDDPPAAEALRTDPVLQPHILRRPGLRVPGSWNRFETAVRVLLGQQVSVAAATTLAARIVDRYGESFDVEPFGLSRQFPPADTLAGASFDGIGMPETRLAMVRGFAAAVADGSIDLYAAGSLDDVASPLQAVPGIGPWSAQLIALRVLRHPDAFPASDLGLRIAVGRLIGEDRPPGRVVAAYADRWRPHRALAAQYLWTSLHDEEL